MPYERYRQFSHVHTPTDHELVEHGDAIEELAFQKELVFIQFEDL